MILTTRTVSRSLVSLIYDIASVSRARSFLVTCYSNTYRKPVHLIKVSYSKISKRFSQKDNIFFGGAEVEILEFLGSCLFVVPEMVSQKSVIELISGRRFPGMRFNLGGKEYFTTMLEPIYACVESL